MIIVNQSRISLFEYNMEKLSILNFLLFIGFCWGLRRSPQCGVPLSQGKIVGGIDSGGYHYPWFALLLLKKNSYLPIPVCAGSLITRFHVLTAAHCFTISSSTQNRDLFSVALGVYDICSNSEATRQIFNVQDVVVHEKYRKNQKFYDIAIIKLDKPADFISICLPLFGVPDITEVAVIIGFGVTGENSGFVPCHMLEVNVTKYSKKDCSSSKLPLEDKRESSVICAGALTGEADSCYGDSGGPLQTLTSDGRYVISGIVSYGYGCGTPDVPGIYTNVGSYIQWINSKISSLGSNESSHTQTSTHVNSKEIPEDSSFGVLFPQQPTSLNRTGGRFSTDTHLRRRKLKDNKAIFDSRVRDQTNYTSKNTTKTSYVKFPE